MDLKEANILGSAIDDHWYYRSKGAALLQLLDSPRHILDIGAGSGFFSRWVLQKTMAECALCIDIEYPEDSDSNEQISGKVLAFQRDFDRSDADVVLLMDVLEHMDDDVALLRSTRQKLEGPARWIITVPALPMLWSSHDVFLEHRRRYALRDLRATVDAAGLRCRQISYFFGALLPVAVVMRLLDRGRTALGGQPRSQLRRHPRWLNAILESICGLELPLMPYNKLAGLSLFCVAESP